jgi:hypothetical protein
VRKEQERRRKVSSLVEVLCPSLIALAGSVAALAEEIKRGMTV